MFSLAVSFLLISAVFKISEAKVIKRHPGIFSDCLAQTAKYLGKFLLTAFILKQKTGRRRPDHIMKKRLRRGVRIVGHGRKYFYESIVVYVGDIFIFHKSFNDVSDEGNEKIVAIRILHCIFSEERLQRREVRLKIA